jgi:hypothetical protein
MTDRTYMASIYRLEDGQKTFMPPPALVFEMLTELLSLTRISTQGV